MKNTTNIKGTEIRCKDNVENNFEKMPSSLHHYAKLGLISGNDYLVYSLLLRYTNIELGYSYPSTKQIALATGLSDGTVKTATKNLQKVGLIRVRKATGFANKNLFYVDMPLEKEVLEQRVPHLVKALQEREGQFQREAMTDKERLHQFYQSRQKTK